MKPIRKTLLLITGAIGALLAFNPSAQAQDVPELNQAQAASAQQQRMIPGVRYTTGAVTTSGWEKSLTDGNPNLRRWNWSAITSYTQSSYNKVPPGAFVQKTNKPEQQALKPTGSIYVKPIQVSPEIYAKKRVQPGVIVVGNTNNTSSVSGRVKLPKQIIASQPPVAKSYNTSYVNGNLRPGDETLAARNVYGRLMRTQ